MTKNNSELCSRRRKSGMTLMEILLVSALITVLGAALYQSLANGVRVWQRSQRLVIEEDIAIFFDKLSYDLRNTFEFSLIQFSGNEFRFSFPTIVRIPAEPLLGLPEGEYIDQVGKVQYEFDLNTDRLYRRVAGYAQALDDRYEASQVVLKGIESIKFKYFYMTDTDEIYTPDILDVTPTGVEVDIRFEDYKGERTISRYIALAIEPAG